MRIVNIEKQVFSFDDLKNNQELKSLVLEKNADININYEWYDFILDDWKEKLSDMGFLEPDISFSGFWSQGDGASFTCKTVDLSVFLEKFGGDIFSDRELQFIKNLEKCYYLWGFAVKRTDHHYSHENTVSVFSEDCFYEFTRYARLCCFLEKSLQNIKNLLQKKVKSLSRQIYRELQVDYEYLTSEDSILETLQANNYEFSEDGTIF